MAHPFSPLRSPSWVLPRPLGDHYAVETWVELELRIQNECERMDRLCRQMECQPLVEPQKAEQIQFDHIWLRDRPSRSDQNRRHLRETLSVHTCTGAVVGRTCLTYCTVHLHIVGHGRSHIDCSVTCNNHLPAYERRRTWDDVGHICAAGCPSDSCKMFRIAGIAGCRRWNSHMGSQLENLDLGVFVGKVGFVDQILQD